MNDHVAMNGLQRKILRKAVLEGFDRDEFEILLSDALDTSLPEITGSAGFEKQVLTVIQWAQRRRKLVKLVEAIVDSRPQIGRMLAFAAPAAPPGQSASSRPKSGSRVR